MGLAGAGMGLANLGNSILGSPTKAALIVRRINEVNPFSLVESALSTLEKASSTAKGLMGALAGGAMRGKVLADYISADKDWDLFEFQYNPDTIYLNSQAGSYMTRQGAPESGINQITMTDVPAQTRMNFKMTFYDINNQDAFLQDKLNLSASAIVKDVMAIVATYSVQTPVEGLVSLITQYATRQAVFVMGDVVFFGEIESVNAQYTMFSPGGNPIAAVVNISMLQSTRGPSGAEDVKSMSDTYWDEAFTKLLGKPGVEKKVESKSILESIGGSMLNLNA